MAFLMYFLAFSAKMSLLRQSDLLPTANALRFTGQLDCQAADFAQVQLAGAEVRKCLYSEELIRAGDPQIGQVDP